MITTNNSRPGRTLAQTLTFAFLGLSLIALLANGGITLFSNIQRQQAIILAQQEIAARNASKQVRGFFDEKYRALEATSRITKLPRGTTEERELILQSLLANQPAFRQLVILDEFGNESAMATRVSLEITAQFMEQIQEAISTPKEPGERYISPLYFDDFDHDPLMMLAIPVDIFDFKGTLAAEVNMQFMWTLIYQIKIGESGYVYVVDKSGNLVAAQDTDRVIAGENVKQIFEVGEFVASPSETGDETLEFTPYIGLTGTRVVGTFISLGTPDWAILTELPVDEAYEPVYQTVTNSLVIILIMSLLAALAGVVVARRLAIPLVDLTGTATRIAGGEVHLQAEAGGAREITTLASAFNAMTTQLSGLIGNLEQRVAERTAELETVNKQTTRRAAQLQAITELSETIAHLQDMNEIFPITIRLIYERFGFYHVGIFLIDRLREYAVLQASNSEGGQRMLARGHRLKLGTGVVGFAAQSGRPRIALDVGADAVFFDNPDLPLTRSEVALPMKTRDETIGVLDVQSKEAGAFSQEDLQVLTALANQVSIALENARLLNETRTALQQVQEVYDEFTRAEWSRTVAQAQQAGFRYQTGRIEMIEKPMNSPEVISAIQKGQVTASNHGSEKRSQVAVPVKLRGEVIGVLHIESNDPDRTWNNDDVTLVEAVAERAAFAMENARLFQDARRRAAKERMISDATARISGALNVENILQTTAEELERVLGGSEVLIQFQSRENS